MAFRRDLNAAPARQFADILSGIRAETAQTRTGAAGVTDYGEAGDATWTNPDGSTRSVREVAAAGDDLAVISDELQGTLDATRESLEGAQGEIDQAKADIAAEAQAREAALADARQALTDLDERLDAAPTTGDLDGIRADLTTARDIADTATRIAGEATTAANAASQAALEAAGIAASKGRVIVQAAEPMGDDRQAANIWIQPIPDDPETDVQEKAVTYVYLADTDEWQPTTSSELAQAAQNALDAREAAQQAQQRADTAIANAAAAQGAAEAAQRTADTATTDARDAHNAAVAAAERAQAAIARGDSLVPNGSLEQGLLGWTINATTRGSVISTPDARSGSRAALFTPYSGASNLESDAFPASPGPVYNIRAWVRMRADTGTNSRVLLVARSLDSGGNNLGIWGVPGGFVLTKNLPVNEWHLIEADYVATDPAVQFIKLGIQAQQNAGDFLIDDVQVTDVTEVRGAQSAAAAAMREAEAKLNEAQVKTIADASQAAAEATARAEVEAAESRAATEALRVAKAEAAREAGEAEAAARAYADLIDTGASDADIAAARAYAEEQAEEARIAAEKAAAADATAKTEAAEARAAADAKAKADKALADAKTDATAKASAAEAAAKTAAAADAASKAATAEANAKTAAAADAKAKADKALTDARADSKSKADAAQAAAIADAAAKDATLKAQAAADAKAKADKALGDALAALATARGQITAEIKASANGKNAVTVSTSGPSGSGVVAGDVWWQTDADGHVFGQWAWTGSKWEPRLVASEMIAALDVGKLVVHGDARMAEAVITKLWVDGLAAKAITASKIAVAPGSVVPNGNGELGDNAFWPDFDYIPGAPAETGAQGGFRPKSTAGSWRPVGVDQPIPVKPGDEYATDIWIHCEDAGSDTAIAYDFLDANGIYFSREYAIWPKGMPAGLSHHSASFTVPDGAAGLRFQFVTNHSNGGSTVQTLYGFNVARKVGGVLIENGAVGADKIIADEVAAEVSNLVEARVEKLKVTDGAEIDEAVIAKLASEMITAGTFRTGETGKRFEVTRNGLDAYSADDRQTVHIDGVDNFIEGTFKTAAAGERIAIGADVYGGQPGVSFVSDTGEAALVAPSAVDTGLPGGGIGLFAGTGKVYASPEHLQAVMSGAGLSSGTITHESGVEIYSQNYGGGTSRESTIDVSPNDIRFTVGSRSISAAELIPSAWASLSLRNGWAVYVGGGGYYPGLRARVSNGSLEIDGMIRSGSVADIATLPSGMRPAYSRQLTVPAGGGTAVIAVRHTGEIQYVSGPGAPAFLAVCATVPLA